MSEEAQKVINEYTGKRIDKVEKRMDLIDDRLDNIDTKIYTMDRKIDSQSEMLQTLVSQQKDSVERRKSMFDSVLTKIIQTVVIVILGFVGTAVMMMLQGK